jgi:hypothetical protein
MKELKAIGVGVSSCEVPVGRALAVSVLTGLAAKEDEGAVVGLEHTRPHHHHLTRPFAVRDVYLRCTPPFPTTTNSVRDTKSADSRVFLCINPTNY